MKSYYIFIGVLTRIAVLLLVLLAGSAFTHGMAAGANPGADPGSDPGTNLASEPGSEPSTSLAITCDGTLLLPGVPCVLTLHAAGLAAMQYAGLELRYDTARLTFQQARPGPVFGDDAVTFARHLPDGRLGVSVSSTTGERDADGGIVHMDFIVSDGAPDGAAGFFVELLEFTDQDGVALSAPLPEGTGITIPPYLSDGGILDPGPVTIARGSELAFRFRLAASGITAGDITGEPGDEERLQAEMIIMDAGSWDGTAPLPDPLTHDRIVPLAYTGTSGGEFRFESPFPSDQSVGTWLVLGRFQLDDHPEIVAGYSSDGGGIWDGEMNTAVEVTVTTPRVTVAEWTFDGEQWTADTGLYHNLQPDAPALVSLVGARSSGWTSGSSGRAPNSNNWQQENNGDTNGSGDDGDDGGNGDDNGNAPDGGNGTGENGMSNGDAPVPHDKYWEATLATSGYHELTLQFRMNGSGTGPRDFRLYYHTGDESDNWQPVPGGDFQSGTSWALHSFSLPADAGDAQDLVLRWVRIGNTSVSGDQIGPTGTNRLDDILITGVPMATDEMVIWPGNTTGEGTVSEADVLSLARYWMSTGPERIPRRIDWAPQPVVRWTPETAAHADTDGDGRVDYRDLLAIGRNFGQTVDSDPKKIAAGDAIQNQPDIRHSDHMPALLAKTLPRLSAGEAIRLVLQSDFPVPLLGISTRFSLDEIPADAWELMELVPGEWAGQWQAADRLIRFHHGRTPSSVHGEITQSTRHKSANAGAADNDKTGYTCGITDDRNSHTWSAAWAHAGMAPAVSATVLVAVTIRALTDWEFSPVLHLNRVSLAVPEGINDRPDTGGWELVRQDYAVTAEPGTTDDRPRSTRLHSSYPNPFNPSTTLSFDLHEPGTVRITIYDALGRLAGTLLEGHRDAGRYKITWDASGFASGMYIIRLEAAHVTQSRQVILLK